MSQHSDQTAGDMSAEVPQWCHRKDACFYPDCLDLDQCASGFVAQGPRADPAAFTFPPRRVRVPSPRSPN